MNPSSFVPHPQPYLRFFFPLEATDNGNVNFVLYKGDYYVSTETNLMHKVDLETLQSKEKVRQGELDHSIARLALRLLEGISLALVYPGNNPD